jgi:Tat protein secretion system quality control protein TatD with DNase activity
VPWKDRKQAVHEIDLGSERAMKQGTMVITGTSVAGSEEGVRIAREYPQRIFATAGVHPHDSRRCTLGTIPELRRLAELAEVVAIGDVRSPDGGRMPRETAHGSG